MTLTHRFLTGLAGAAALAMLPWAGDLHAAGPDDLQVGHWTIVSSNTVSSLDPCPARNCAYSGNEGQPGVMDDWSGGAYAGNLGTYGSLLVFGGGHGGYLGNEVYAFDIAQGAWSRLTDPANPPDCNLATSSMADNSPCSAHMYEALEYSPVTSEFVKLGSSSDAHTVLGTAYVHALDVNTGNWRRGAKMPTWEGTASDDGEGATTAWDSKRNVIWWHGSWRAYATSNKTLRKYNPVTDTWTEYPGVNVNIDAAMAYDAQRDILVINDGRSNNRVVAFDLSTANPTSHTLNTTGDTSAQQSSAIGFDWDSTAKVFVAWMGGSQVYTLSPPASGDWRTGTWTWTRVNAASGNQHSPAKNSRGTYGRFRYVPALNGFIVVNTTTGPTYMYRLTAGSGTPPPSSDPAPTVDFAASPTSVASGGATSLSWSSTNASSCVAGGAWSGSKTTTGSESVGPLASTGTYTLTCTGSGGSASKSVVVTVVDAGPVVSLMASPESVAVNGSSVLSWSVSNATSCTASGGWSGSKALSGSQTVGPLASGATFTLNCTGAGGSAQRSAVVSVVDPGQGADFDSRCAASGVVKCVGFDTSANFASSVLYPAGDGVVRGTMDTNIKASGAGSLRFMIPSRSGANMSGFWLDSLGADFGQNQTFYVQFRQRFSPEMLSTYYEPGGGWKQVIIHGAASCASLELTTVNQYLRGFPQMYTDCGARNFHVESGGQLLLQQGDYNCPYSNQSSSGCGRYRANEWMTFYYHIQIGQWNSPNSNIRAYMAYEGEPLKQFVDIRNYSLNYDSSVNDKYQKIQLTPYMTGKNSSQDHPTAYTWYDELIVSTQPIAAPGNAAAPPPAQTPVVSLTATPQSITAGSTTGLTWSASNADSCTASGGWSGSRPVSGALTAGPLNQNTTYTLTCVNAVGDSSAQSVTVTVTEPDAAQPQLDFYAQPNSVQIGQSSVLYWSAVDATRCYASGAWSGDKALVDSEPVWLDHEVTYVLTCENGSNTVTRSATVQVVSPDAPTVSIQAVPTTIPAGATSILTWSSVGATGCEASGGWTGSRAVSGTETVGPLSATTSYSLVCTGAGGPTQRVISVTVEPPPPPPAETGGGTSGETGGDTSGGTGDGTSGEGDGGTSGGTNTGGSAASPDSDAQIASGGGSSAFGGLEWLLMLFSAVTGFRRRLHPA